MDSQDVTKDEHKAHHRRQAAAKKYQPKRIRLLLVAEAPPEDLDRYFYFEEAASTDPLFEYVGKVLFEAAPSGDKAPFLGALRRRGIFVIELKPDGPIGKSRHDELAQWLPLRVETLAPEKVILIKSSVFNAAHPELLKAGLPVVDQSVGFSSGRQKEFEIDFTRALVKAGLENLIRPLPKAKQTPSATEEEAH